MSFVNPGASSAYAVQNPILLVDSTLGQLEFSTGGVGAGVRTLQSSYGFKMGGRPFIAFVQSVQYGTFDGTDIWGTAAGTFAASDVALGLGTTLYTLGPVNFGMNLKVVNGSYESYQSWAATTDLVAMYKAEGRPDVAIMLRNFGTQLTTFSGNKEPLPLDVVLAVGDKLEHAPLRWTLVLDRLQQPMLGYDDPNTQTVDPLTGQVVQGEQSVLNLMLRHFGGALELMPTERLHLLMGYCFRRQFELALPERRTSGGFSGGVALYFSKFQLHFAHELRSVAGRANTLSLTLNL
jgi:hypothetical protein